MNVTSVPTAHSPYWGEQDTATFLLSRMDGLDLGLDYKAFAHKVFGVMRNS